MILGKLFNTSVHLLNSSVTHTSPCYTVPPGDTPRPMKFGLAAPAQCHEPGSSGTEPWIWQPA